MLESAKKSDIYTRITQQIIDALEQGVRPWEKPWKCGSITQPYSHALKGS